MTRYFLPLSALFLTTAVQTTLFLLSSRLYVGGLAYILP